MRSTQCLVARIALVAALAITGYAPAGADTFTWDGGGGNVDWQTDANWGGTAPTPAFDVELVFDGTTNLNTNNDFTSGSNFHDITFAAGAGAFTLDGNQIRWAHDGTLGGTITNDSSNLQTINFDIDLPGHRNVVANGELLLSGDISAGHGGNGIVKTGAGTLTLTGGYTKLGDGVTNFTSNGGNFIVTGSVDGGSKPLELQGSAHGEISGVLTDVSAVQKSGAGTWTLSGGIVKTGAVTLQASDGQFLLSGDITGSNNSVTLIGAANGEISGEVVTAYQVTMSGTGTWTLSGDNSYTSITKIQAGTLVAAHDNALGTTALGTTIAGNATLALRGDVAVGDAITMGEGATESMVLNLSGNNEISGDINKQGVTRFRSDAGRLLISGNVGGNNNSIRLAGAGNGEISGNITTGWDLSKEGTGTWILSGDNAYSGGNGTFINGGTLLVNGNYTGSMPHDVAAGGILGGTGTIGADATIQSGGTLAPGASIGEFTINGDVDLDGTLQIEFDENSIDLLHVGGALNIGSGGLDFQSLAPLGLATGEAHVFATYGSLVGDAFAQILNQPAYTELIYNYQGSNSMALMAAPEPGTYALGLLAALGVGLMLRRRRTR